MRMMNGKDLSVLMALSAIFLTMESCLACSESLSFDMK